MDSIIDIEDMHTAACLNHQNTFIHPKTGATVFTSYFLSKRKCCGNKCLFCPHGHINVKNHTCTCELQTELQIE